MFKRLWNNQQARAQILILLAIALTYVLQLTTIENVLVSKGISLVIIVASIVGMIGNLRSRAQARNLLLYHVINIAAVLMALPQVDAVLR